jgi:CTP:molybdopterin cytidylyltransferase MocA
VILPRAFAADLPADDVAGGLQTLIAQSTFPVLTVAVEDAGVLRNINKAADWGGAEA